MTESTENKRSTQSKIVFAFSLFTAVYWALVMTIDVYRVSLVGVFYEILWLPMIAAIFILPVVALVYWIIERFYINSLYFYSLLALLMSILLIVTVNIK